MKRNLLILSVLVLGVLVMVGCSTPQHSNLSDESPALVTVGPDYALEDAGPGVFSLGAGDALGSQIFVKYVAHLRAHGGSMYATVDTAPPPPNE